MTYQCDPCVCPEQHYRTKETFMKAVITLLCRIVSTIIEAAGGGILPTVVATFHEFTGVAKASIGAGYVLAIDLPDGTRQVILDNQTNGDVLVSMDAGAHDHYHLKGGDKLILNLIAIGTTTSAQISLRNGTAPGNTGTFFIYYIS